MAKSIELDFLGKREIVAIAGAAWMVPFAADFVLTMDAANRVINDGAVLVRGDRIAAVGTLADMQRDYPHAAPRKLPNGC